MTDDNEYPIDDLNRAIADYFANRPPSDVVPRKHTELDRDAILFLDLMASKDRVVTTIPAQVLTDDMGRPIGATEKETVEAVVATVMVTRAQLTAAGLTEADVPHLSVVGDE